MPQQKKAKHKSFESRNKHGRFLKLTINMLESPAWQALTVYEQALYMAIKAKYKGVNRNGQDTDRDLSFTYEEGLRLMSKTRFIKAIDRLIETGFIDLVTHLPQAREPTIYGLSSRWHDYGKPEFKEAKRIRRAPPRGKE